MGRSVNRTAKRWSQSNQLKRQLGLNTMRAWSRPSQTQPRARCSKCGCPTSKMDLRRINGQDVGPCCQRGEPDSN